MYLGIDTETSGLARDSDKPEDPGQPHLVQLGIKTWTDDWKPRCAISVLIKPEGWTIEPEAQRIHGITEARAARFGVRLGAALLMLQDLASTCRTIFAHNMQYDRLIITAALYRAGGAGLWWARRANDMRCTMEEATPLCQLKGEFSPYRFPKLEEAHAILRPDLPLFKSRHDALEDIEAAADVLKAIDARRDG